MHSHTLKRTVPACVLAWISLAAPPAQSAQPANWFALDTNGTASSIEVDVGSLRWRGERRELRVRLSYAQPQLQADGTIYRSVLAAIEVNCDSGQTYWHSASFHPDAKAEHLPLRGEHYNTGLPAGYAHALIPEKTWATLRRSACVQPRSSVP